MAEALYRKYKRKWTINRWGRIIKIWNAWLNMGMWEWEKWSQMPYQIHKIELMMHMYFTIDSVLYTCILYFQLNYFFARLWGENLHLDTNPCWRKKNTSWCEVQIGLFQGKQFHTEKLLGVTFPPKSPVNPPPPPSVLNTPVTLIHYSAPTQTDRKQQFQ